MDHWITIDSSIIPNSNVELTLLQRNDDFAIRIAGVPGDLMNSRMHHSEDELAKFGCSRLSTVENAQVLVGGLGMGFTLAAVLKTVGASAQVTVAELVPAVVEWNRGALGQCAARPIEDQRTRVQLCDVADLLRLQSAKQQPFKKQPFKHQSVKQQAVTRPIDPQDQFDAILLDVDNGPEAMTHSDNEWLYSLTGLKSIYEKLRPEGIVAIWSASANPIFTKKLKKTGFNVQEHIVRARPGKGSRHTIFVAQKG
ncbi:MAG: spermidine synthase [Chitinophagales bacterium]|jgi:spermidine synthase